VLGVAVSQTKYCCLPKVKKIGPGSLHILMSLAVFSRIWII